MKIYKFLFLLFFVAFIYSEVDRSIVILHHADISRSYVKNGEVVRVLSGNVFATIDTIDFFCDSTQYYPARNLLKFYGNVQIINQDQRIFSEYLDYYRDQKIAIARKNVKLLEPGHALFAEKIKYHTLSKNSEGFFNVVMNDSLNNIFATCEHYLHFPAKKLLTLIDHVKVLKLDENGRDSTFIYCDTLEYYNQENNEKTFARGNVQVLKKNMIAKSQQAAFFISADSIILTQHPVILIDNNSIYADKIKILLNEGRINTIKLIKNAEMHSIIDSIGPREDVLKAKMITLHFKNDSLREVYAHINAVGKYNIQEEGVNGINYVTADSIKIILKNNKADSLFVLGGVEGSFYPEQFMDMVP